jgi:hypothetical protein
MKLSSTGCEGNSITLVMRNLETARHLLYHLERAVRVLLAIFPVSCPLLLHHLSVRCLLFLEQETEIVREKENGIVREKGKENENVPGSRIGNVKGKRRGTLIEVMQRWRSISQVNTGRVFAVGGC